MEQQQVSILDGGIQTIQGIFGGAATAGLDFLKGYLDNENLENELDIRAKAQRDAQLYGATGMKTAIPQEAAAREAFGNTGQWLMIGGLMLVGTVALIAALRK